MTEQEFDLFEKFWRGAMSPQEKDDFERRLNTDGDFKKQLEVFSTLQKGIKAYGRNELRRNLFLPTEIPFMVRLGKKYRYAAFALPLILIAVIFLRMPSGNEKLYNQYYSKADTITFARPGDESAAYQTKLRAYGEFKAGNHDAANALISDIPEEDSEGDLLAGLNFIHLDRIDEAMQNLQEASQSSGKVAASATWYIALLHLKKGDRAKARNTLRQLGSYENPYQRHANELLEKLK
jgi:hypothetical protein